MTKALPDFLSHMLDNPPSAGSGVHAWLFNVSRNLHAHFDPDAIVSLLEESTANCGRRVARREIENAVVNSAGCAWRRSGANLLGRVPPTLNRSCKSAESHSPWPKLDERERAAVIKNGGDLAVLRALSSPGLGGAEPVTEDVIDMLFPGDPLLCCGESRYEPETKRRESWRGRMSAQELIVPSPMSSPVGITQNGEESARALTNTGPRHYLIVEFDSGSADEQAALLMHLGSTAALACVVYSGGKSLHGWFPAKEHSEDTVRSFFSYAVSIGADPALWIRNQFVRMPGGLRDNGKRQKIYYLNQNLMGGVL